MIGTPADPGVMVRIMNDLYLHAAMLGNERSKAYRVSVSFLEIYNENIRDLLSETQEYLDLREDPIKGPIVAGVTEVEAKSGNAVMELLHQGNARRSQASTAANEVSSRSHAVLQVVVECKDRAPGTVANIKVGKLSLIDLAGSERAANTKNTGARLVEGANINRSLLALGNCINALGEKGNKGNFVPYRDSKLTRLLKDSLGGNCRTVMIANVNPSEASFEETLNTLKYANRAKNIKTTVQRNVLNVNYHISEYVALINNLRGEIKLLKEQMDTGPAEAPDANGVLYENQMDRNKHDGSDNNQPGFNGRQMPAQCARGGRGADQPPVHPNRNGRDGGRGPSSPKGSNIPSTPLLALRESLKSGALSSLGTTSQGIDRELVNSMRQKIVDNFQERMQLRRSLIELEDQNVQNSIEIGKRQLMVVQWSHHHGYAQAGQDMAEQGLQNPAEFTADLISRSPDDVKEAWHECEQLRKACVKNNSMKKNISKRLRHNEKEAEKFREELSTKITGEERKELMELQYQVGRLELENMELEQHRIVHESILKGKDLTIQKLKLQLAVRDKLIQRQQQVLSQHGLENEVGYKQLALMEESLLADPLAMSQSLTPSAPPSPPRQLKHMNQGANARSNNNGYLGGNANGVYIPQLDVQAGINQQAASNLGRARSREGGGQQGEAASGLGVDFDIIPLTDREQNLTSRDRIAIQSGDWSEVRLSPGGGGNRGSKAPSQQSGGNGSSNAIARGNVGRGGRQYVQQGSDSSGPGQNRDNSIGIIKSQHAIQPPGRDQRGYGSYGNDDQLDESAESCYGNSGQKGGSRYQQQQQQQQNNKFVAKLEPLSNTVTSSVTEDPGEEQNNSYLSLQNMSNISQNNSNISSGGLGNMRSRDALIHPDPGGNGMYPEKPRTPRSPSGSYAGNRERERVQQNQEDHYGNQQQSNRQPQRRQGRQQPSNANANRDELSDIDAGNDAMGMDLQIGGVGYGHGNQRGLHGQNALQAQNDSGYDDDGGGNNDNNEDYDYPGAAAIGVEGRGYQGQAQPTRNKRNADRDRARQQGGDDDGAAGNGRKAKNVVLNKLRTKAKNGGGRESNNGYVDGGNNRNMSLPNLSKVAPAIINNYAGGGGNKRNNNPSVPNSARDRD